MKFFTMTTLFWLRANAKKARKPFTIYIRITIDGQRWEKSTGLQVNASDWNQKRQKTTNKTYNNLLQSIEAKVIQQYNALYSHQSEITITDLKLAMQPASKFIISDLLDKFIMYKAKFVTPGSLKNYRTFRKNLLPFVKKHKVQYVRHIDLKLAHQYNDYLLERYGSYHVKKQVTMLKSFCAWLFNLELIKSNPIYAYKARYDAIRVKPISISKEELTTIANYIFASERLNQVKDLFLLQCYTGISYSDIKLCSSIDVMEKEGVVYLCGTRSKTNIEFTVPGNIHSLELLHRYNFEMPKLSNQKYNSYLKEVAEILGIKKRLTTHVGRRSFAQLHLDLGYSFEALANMLGHADPKTTKKHYAKTSFDRVHNETKSLAA